MTNIAMERSTIFKNGKPSINGPFSMAMLNNQRDPEGIYTYIYMYIYICMYVYIYMYIYICDHLYDTFQYFNSLL